MFIYACKTPQNEDEDTGDETARFPRLLQVCLCVKSESVRLQRMKISEGLWVRTHRSLCLYFKLKHKAKEHENVKNIKIGLFYVAET